MTELIHQLERLADGHTLRVVLLLGSMILFAVLVTIECWRGDRE